MHCLVSLSIALQMKLGAGVLYFLNHQKETQYDVFLIKESILIT